jgi:hypothetical protein
MNDMVAFLKAQIEPPDSIKNAILLTHTSHATFPELNGQIALAWMIIDTIDSDYFWHNGITGGFRAFIAFNGDGKGVVILSNSSVGIDELGHAFMNGQLDEYKDLLLQTPKTVKTNEFAKYVGTYELTESFLLKVYIDGELLMVQATGQNALPVFKKSEDLFYYKAVKAELEFKAQGDKISSLVLFQNGQKIKATKVK